MKLRKDPSGAIELLLWDMAPADIDRIAKTVLSEVATDGPVSITHIAGDAVNCAIGSGALLTARDLLTVLESRGDSDPLIRELLARLNRLPSLDVELPEKASISRAAEEAAQRAAAARLERELVARKLADPSGPDFGKTKYGKRMACACAQQQVVPIRAVGTFIALGPAPLVRHEDRQRFFQWMNCNQRRYAPVNDGFFLPCSIPAAMSKAHVWHNGHPQRLMSVQPYYFTYLAAELEEGYLEYGFCAGSPLEPEGDKIYYAKVLGGFVAFLRFVRDLADKFGGDPSAISVGLALRGTAGTSLRCITKQVVGFAQVTSPPETDGFQWVNRATPGTDWSVDRLARQVAVELLDHWSYYPGPGFADTPEFRDGNYTGDYYRSDFHGQWC